MRLGRTRTVVMAAVLVAGAAACPPAGPVITTPPPTLPAPTWNFTSGWPQREHLPQSLSGHDAGVFVVDINAAVPGVLAHLEDVANFPAFGQLAVEGGHVIQANSDALVLWG